MDLSELKKEQVKLASRISLQDGFSSISTIGGAACVQVGDKLAGAVVVCEFPSLKLIEKQTFVLSDPLPHKPGFAAYREMPALIEAFNKLEKEPDVLLVEGEGIAHLRRIGIASHLGLVLNIPTIGVADKLSIGAVKEGKIIVDLEVLGFEIKTREHSNPVYASPGHLISLGSVLNILKQTIVYPHKMPEPLHLASKIARKVK
ncbi:MAG TPA: endonuclease V [Candidatus Nanoarchaeia archaeon]|nr:endonuclease V [Candidatus Nanoarchaeia archaeon]